MRLTVSEFISRKIQTLKNIYIFTFSKERSFPVCKRHLLLKVLSYVLQARPHNISFETFLVGGQQDTPECSSQALWHTLHHGKTQPNFLICGTCGGKVEDEMVLPSADHCQQHPQNVAPERKPRSESRRTWQCR